MLAVISSFDDKRTGKTVIDIGVVVLKVYDILRYYFILGVVPPGTATRLTTAMVSITRSAITFILQ